MSTFVAKKFHDASKAQYLFVAKQQEQHLMSDKLICDHY
jgi:hypothetical protein